MLTGKMSSRRRLRHTRPSSPGRRDGLWSRRDKGGVERPHRGCHQQVREDAALVQRVQHSHLHGAEAPAAR